tara:strand:- start:791 stop:1399 length:609 start_codon:yes stop_codon:yes gene_type:complete
MPTPEEPIEAQILEAASDVFVEKGFEKSKMQDIADKAGIKRTVLNYYFRSKDLLYKKIAKTVIKQALPNMLKLLNSDLPFEEKIAAFVDNYMNLALKNPHLPLFVINELHSLGVVFIENMLDGVRPNIHKFIAHAEEEMEKGNIVQMNPVQIPIHLVSLCAFPILAKPMVMLITDTSETQYKEIIAERKKEVVRFVLAGLKP